MTLPIFRIMIIGFLLAGCVLGGNLDKLHIANHPSGNQISVILINTNNMYGELLAMDENGIYMLESATRKIFRITSEEASELKIVNANLSFRKGAYPNQRRISAYQKYSRYPRGINDELLVNLLAAYQQDELFIIE